MLSIDSASTTHSRTESIALMLIAGFQLANLAKLSSHSSSSIRNAPESSWKIPWIRLDFVSEWLEKFFNFQLTFDTMDSNEQYSGLCSRHLSVVSSHFIGCWHCSNPVEIQKNETESKTKTSQCAAAREQPKIVRHKKKNDSGLRAPCAKMNRIEIFSRWRSVWYLTSFSLLVFNSFSTLLDANECECVCVLPFMQRKHSLFDSQFAHFQMRRRRRRKEDEEEQPNDESLE